MICAYSKDRETLVGHIPLNHYFCRKDDFTIFRIFEKRFKEQRIGAHVVHHPELVKLFPSDELVYWLTEFDLKMIQLIYKRM